MARHIDPHALAALNARYDARFAALWSAAQAAATSGAGPGQPARLADVVDTPPGDQRFAAPEWTELPYFSWLRQSYLLASEYTTELARLTDGSDAERRRVEFLTRQWVDALAPTNFIATNPEAIRRAMTTGGSSFAQGFANLCADLAKGRISMTDERAFAVGENLATTPGAVVFRNELIELIQYDAATPSVYARPLVIVPPCINKYYILDLRPDNSFVRYAVNQGHTVFIVSWRNIGEAQGSLTWDDYLTEGVLTAIDVAREISGSANVNALGFCVGGTLLACALAVLAARDEPTVTSATLLTTLLDFDDPGDIGVYVTREALALREPALASGQRVHGREIAVAFASLRANSLVWNYVVNNYLKGETPPAFDLLYWNSDSANLPGPMYLQYLRDLYLDNRLREHDAMTMAGAPIDLARVTLPTYVLAAREDHIVPWRSAYRATALLGRSPTFVLGASGHIAGVVNPPEKRQRSYWTSAALPADAEQWLAGATITAGSWWPHWSAWLAPYGGELRTAPAATGSAAHRPIARAPGEYVRELVG
jgi:polyhydroxyalkanoate synthase